MNFFYDKNSKNFRTKPLYNFLFCLIFMVIPGIILWLMFGYINFSENFLVFPAYGIIANGSKQEILNHLTEIANSSKVYEPIRIACNDLKTLAPKYIDSLNGHPANLWNFSTSYISPLICAVIIPYLTWSLVLPFLGKLTKIINYDVISFSFTCAGVFSVIILSGAIPVGSFKETTNYFGQWIILARIVIAVFAAAVFFAIANKIVMICLGLSKDQNDYYMQLTNETLEVQKREEEFKKQRKLEKEKNKEPNYVELDPKQIKFSKDKSNKKGK